MSMCKRGIILKKNYNKCKVCKDINKEIIQVKQN